MVDSSNGGMVGISQMVGTVVASDDGSGLGSGYGQVRGIGRERATGWRAGGTPGGYSARRRLYMDRGFCEVVDFAVSSLDGATGGWQDGLVWLVG
jgi:hypothetical protein